MHYFKQLASTLSLGLFLTVGATFHATPPTNAKPIQDNDCILQAIGFAANMDVPLVADITGVMEGPALDGNDIPDYLQAVGFGRRRPIEFYTREALIRYLRTNNTNAAYIVGWRVAGNEIGHVVNARVINGGEPIFIDAQCGNFTSPPRNGQRYFAWFVEDIRFGNRFGNPWKKMKRDDRGATSSGDFTSSCRDITLFTNVDRRDTVQLSAKCEKKNDSNLTGIDLSDYIINSSGGLLWQKGGGFGGSVRNCRLRRSNNITVLQCEASNGKGKWKNAAINLDHKIFNDNGRLKVRF